jgi:CHAD domain-containing protein
MPTQSEITEVKTSFKKMSFRKFARAYCDSQLHKFEISLQSAASGDDPEAIHDIRVATRRLHSFIKHFKNYTSLPKRINKDLKEIINITNTQRDREIIYLWLQENKATLQKVNQKRFNNSDLNKLSQPSTDHINIKSIERLYSKSRRLLTDKISYKKGIDFLAVFTQEINADQASLRELLDQYKQTPDLSVLHKIRITVKRLRYLLELDPTDNAELRTAQEDLITWQDRLGEINDLRNIIAFLALQTADSLQSHTHAIDQTLTSQPLSSRQLQNKLITNDVYVYLDFLKIAHAQLERDTTTIDQINLLSALNETLDTLQVTVAEIASQFK